MIVAQKNQRAQKLSSTKGSYQYSWIDKERRSENSSSGFKDRLLTLCIYVLPSLNAQSEQTLFQSTAGVSRTAYYMAKNKQTFHKLWKFNWSSGRKFPSHGACFTQYSCCCWYNRSCVFTDEKKLSTKIIEWRSKINVLADESTRVGDKSTLIIFVKASVDGEAEPVTFRHWIWLNSRPCASHIKDAIWDCFLKNGFTNELL